MVALDYKTVVMLVLFFFIATITYFCFFVNRDKKSETPKYEPAPILLEDFHSPWRSDEEIVKSAVLMDDLIPDSIFPNDSNTTDSIIKDATTETLLKFQTDYSNNPSTRWDILVAAGDVYARGSFPMYSPDATTAELLYKAGAMSPDATVAGISQMKLFEMKLSPVPYDDVSESAKTMDSSIGRQMYTLAVSTIQSTPWNLFNTPRYAGNRNQEETRNQRETQNQRDTFVNQGDTQNQPRRNVDGFYDDLIRQYTPPILEEDEIHEEYKNDAQNVHDHAVMQALAKNVESIKTRSDDGTQADDARNLINKIWGMPTLKPDERANAIKVASSLGDTMHSKFKMTEREVLSSVMKEIEKEVDASKKDSMYEILARQMAGSVENGMIVCPSGKIARMMSTFDGVKADMEPVRPMWAVREEISALASKMRDQGADPKEFVDEGRRIYVEKLEMSPEIIGQVLEEYALGF